MHTVKIYRNFRYQKKAQGKLLEIREDSRGRFLIFRESLFAPEGGGQSSDFGVIRNAVGDVLAEIDHVEERDEVLYHHVSALPLGEDPLHKGEYYEQEINWEHRFDNMQRHLGEHILSGVFHSLYGGVNKGFHMSDEGIVIDIALEEGRITWDMAQQAEYLANEIIWRNEPVIYEHFETREEAEKRPLRKALAFDRDISIVTVGDYDNPSDCVACCGTHPAFTGEVGLIKIYRIEPNKGMSRIYLEVGARAYKRLQQDTNTLYDVACDLSAGSRDLLTKYHAQKQKKEETADRLRYFRNLVYDREAEALLKERHSMQIQVYGDFSVADLFEIGKRCIGNISDFLILASKKEHALAVFSDGGDYHAGKFVKETILPYGARGGGGDTNARVVFPDKASLEAFLRAFS